MEDLRLTLAVAEVLGAFLDDVDRPRYGYDLMAQTGFPSGKLYPVLARLQRAGWLSREPERIDPVVAGRPARVLYRLTPDGQERARLELTALGDRLAPAVGSRSRDRRPASGRRARPALPGATG